MRKLIVIAHSLYKNNCVYDAQVYQNACGKVQLQSNIEEVVA